MTSPSARRYRLSTAWMLGACVAATAIAAGLHDVIGDASVPPGSHNWDAGLTELLVWELVMITAAVVGWLVARGQPHNRIGWIFTAGGLIGCLAALSDQISRYALVRDLPAGEIANHLSFAGLYVSWGLLGVFVPLMFPDGKFQSRRWQAVAVFGAISMVATASEMFRPDIFSEARRDIPGATNPIAIPGFEPIAEAIESVGILGLFGAMFLGVGSLVVRLFRTHGIERQQLKVVAYTAVTVVIGLLVVANLHTALRETVFAAPLSFISTLLVMSIPASLGVAILRYRLYDFDLVIRKTIVYGAMAGFITIVYVSIVVGVGALIGRRDSDPLSIVATVVAAVAFQPVRDRVQRIANRLVFGQRSTPYEVMAGFAERVGEVLSFDEVLPRMAEAAARGVGAVAARAEVLLDQDETRSASWPEGQTETGTEHTIDVRHRGEQVGRLSVIKPVNDPLRAAEEKLLNDLAAQAGVAMRNVQLAAQLQDSFEQISRQAEELRESRTRIVQAQDAERKRIERDLHDGAQQRLIALTITMRLAMNRATGDEELNALLQNAAAELKIAHSELRDLARGIHPAILTDSGLRAAVQSLADRAPVPVAVNVPGERYEPAVEAAAYFIVSEGLTNVAKYAEAKSASVAVVPNDGLLHIEVADDGKGGADASKGSGLNGLLDRVAALNGTLTVDSPSGLGTRLKVTLPCA